MGAGGLGALAFLTRAAPIYAASGELLAPAVAAGSLTAHESFLFEGLCEAIVPGARAASVGRYLDYQLSLSPDDCLLFARYLPIATPYLSFYRQGASAIDAAAQRIGPRAVRQMSSLDWRLLAQGLLRKSLVDWNGPPSELLYSALRNDALDVVYATEEGLRKLGIPLMRHSQPAPPFDRGK